MAASKSTVKPLASVVVAIVERDQKYLMVLRKNRTGELSWVFPGGKRNQGEQEKTASKREVAEETGIHCAPRTRLARRVHPDTNAEIGYWICSYRNGSIRNREPDKIDDIRWMTPEEIRVNVTSDLFEPVAAYLFGRSRDRSSAPHRA